MTQMSAESEGDFEIEEPEEVGKNEMTMPSVFAG